MNYFSDRIKDFASKNLRPAKSFHIVRTLTEEELQNLERRVSILKGKNTAKAEKLEKVLEWQRALKNKVISIDQARAAEAWQLEELQNMRQTIVFMENVSHLTNGKQSEIEELPNLYQFTKSLLRRFGVEHQDLRRCNVMLSKNPDEPHVIIDPDYNIPYILKDTRRSDPELRLVYRNLKNKGCRQRVYNPESRASLPHIDVPERFRTEENDARNPLQSLSEMWCRLTGLRRQAREVHNELKPPISKSDSDASLN